MMAVEIDSRTDDGEPLLPYRRRRRPWWVIGGAIAFLLVVLSAGWVGTNVIYHQPLQPGPWRPPPNEGATLLTFVGDAFEVIPVQANAEFRVGTSIANRGNQTVRISNVAPVFSDYYFEPIATMMVPVESYNMADLRPFEPFDLAPHESAWVGHLYRFRDCPFPSSDPRPLHQRLEEDGTLLEGAQMSWPDIEVEFSVRGWTRHTSVDFVAMPILDGLGDLCPAADVALGITRD